MGESKAVRTEDLKKIVLRMFGSREFYGYEVHKKLASEKIEVGISRLYRVLTGMLQVGLLEGRWEKGQLGPRKRVYRIGEKGKKEREKLLLDAIETVHGFYSEYLLNLPAKTNVLNSMCKLLSSNVDRKGEIAYISSQYSVMHEKILHYLHGKVPQAKIYFIKPASLAVDRNFDNLWFLNGTYDNIPLRSGFVDLEIVAKVPEKDSLEKSLSEWHRVLKQSGTLAIVTPTVLIRKYKDPLSIGNFIEKYEHEALEKGEYMETEPLRALLQKFFHKVEEKQIVHMTIFLAHKPHFPPQ
ncbi:MAG: helix-turn-helix transcriptional regulator [Candidatus Bathyarchaeia archaeon]